jgi:hypothetical protein
MWGKPADDGINCKMRQYLATRFPTANMVAVELYKIRLGILDLRLMSKDVIVVVVVSAV